MFQKRKKKKEEEEGRKKGEKKDKKNLPKNLFSKFMVILSTPTCTPDGDNFTITVLQTRNFIKPLLKF